MKTKERDINSYIDIINSFIDLSDLDKEKSEIIKKELKTYISTKFEKQKWVHPEITKFCTDWYREFYRLIDYKDPYKELKENSNKIALTTIKNLYPKNIEESIIIGIIGNKIDYGACKVHSCDLNKISEDFKNLNSYKLYFNDTNQLKDKLKHSKKIVFLVDNNGEILFDTFLLNEIRKSLPRENLFIVGKETPMLNDATCKDLRELNFNKYGTIFSTGSNCFGLHYEDVSNECKELLKNADLIIAKGQAYLEFFTEYNFTNVINILIVKHPIINPALGTIPSGSMAVISSERYAPYGKEYFRE